MTPGLAGTPPRVAYGLDKAPALTAGPEHFPRVPLHPGEVLRLNSEAFELPAPAIGQEMVAIETRLVDHLKRLSGGWNRVASLFIDGYFAHLHRVVATHRPEIAERLRPMAGLFAPEDVIYSAPLPLPRAALPLHGEDGSVELVPVDVMFWLGAGVVAVLFAPSPLTPAAERRRRDRLAMAGIDVRVLAASDLARPAVFTTLLGDSGGTFWKDELFPAAPGVPRLPAF